MTFYKEYGIMLLFLSLGACERYFISLYEDYKREIKGTKDRHRVQQRRLRRKKQVPIVCGPSKYKY